MMTQVANVSLLLVCQQIQIHDDLCTGVAVSVTTFTDVIAFLVSRLLSVVVNIIIILIVSSQFNHLEKYLTSGGSPDIRHVCVLHAQQKPTWN